MSFYTVEEFIGYQQQLIGRKLTDNEIRVVNECVPVFNIFYDEGRNNNTKYLIDVLGFLNDYIMRNVDIAKIMEIIRNWIIFAWSQGHDDR